MLVFAVARLREAGASLNKWVPKRELGNQDKVWGSRDPAEQEVRGLLILLNPENHGGALVDLYSVAQGDRFSGRAFVLSICGEFCV